MKFETEYKIHGQATRATRPGIADLLSDQVEEARQRKPTLSFFAINSSCR
jgi:hypothetical protein